MPLRELILFHVGTRIQSDHGYPRVGALGGVPSTACSSLKHLPSPMSRRRKRHGENDEAGLGRRVVSKSDRYHPRPDRISRVFPCRHHKSASRGETLATTLWLSSCCYART